MEKKGGDIGEYTLYLNAISGIDIDVTDAGATYSALIGWLTSEEGGIRWGMNIIKFFLMLIAFYVLSVICGRLSAKAINAWKGLSEILRHFLVKAVRRMILAVGFVVSLTALEINVGPVMAVIGAAGFVVAFALQGTLSNFASGLLIMFYRPFDVGDIVDVAGVQGTVSSMTLMSTRIKSFDNKIITVPNNSIWGGVITNATASDIRRVDLVFGIGYGDSIDKAQGILENIVKDHELVMKTPETVIRVHELADSSVNFICRPWVKTGDYWTVYWDITSAVKKRFDEEGVSIPFPQQDVHVHTAAAAEE